MIFFFRYEPDTAGAVKPVINARGGSIPDAANFTVIPLLYPSSPSGQALFDESRVEILSVYSGRRVNAVAVGEDEGVYARFIATLFAQLSPGERQEIQNGTALVIWPHGERVYLVEGVSVDDPAAMMAALVQILSAVKRSDPEESLNLLAPDHPVRLLLQGAAAKQLFSALIGFLQVHTIEPFEVYVWQGAEEDIPDLPDFVRPRPVSVADLPVQGPILVAAMQWHSFAQAVVPDQEGRLPEAILYLRHHEERPPGSAPFFDVVVREGQWETLRRHIEDARQVRLLEYASDLSPRLINQLPYPLEPQHLRRLPLPPDIRRALRRDEASRRAFSEQIEVYRKEQWSDPLFKPTSQDLADYLLNRFSPATEPYIDDHLARSSVLQAEYDFLRQSLLQEPLVAVNIVADPAAEPDVAPAVARQHGLLLLLLISLEQARLRPRSLRYFRGKNTDQPPDAPQGKTDLGQVLTDLLDGETVTLVMEEEDHEVDVHYDAEADGLLLEKLQRTGGFEKHVFFVQLRRDDKIVWEQRSIAGQATIPLKTVRTFLDKGADRMCIVAA